MWECDMGGEDLGMGYGNVTWVEKTWEWGMGM